MKALLWAGIIKQITIRLGDVFVQEASNGDVS